MTAATLRLQITIVTDRGNVGVLIPRASTDLVRDVVASLIREFTLPGEPLAWELIYRGRILAPDQPLGEVLPVDEDPVSLTLRSVDPYPTPRVAAPAAPAPPSQAPPAPAGAAETPTAPSLPAIPAPRPADTGTFAIPGSPPRSAPQTPPAKREAPDTTRSRGRVMTEYKKGMKGVEDEPPQAEAEEADDLDLGTRDFPVPVFADDEDEDDTAPARQRRDEAAPAKAKRTTQRRATVRYYSRMNPDRVFPLLVMLTRQEVERVVKRHVEQKATGPIEIAQDVPLEIEPVLPGCAVHPPKIVTRLGAADEVFTFHVVPHVHGTVTGARVLIRQDHATIAEIALDMKVVERTWVMVSGLATFAVPAMSAAMTHFGLDFTPKDGSSFYLTALNFLFSQVSPAVLTGVLALVTLGLWWFTRPKGRDVFWDISTKPAEGK